MQSIDTLTVYLGSSGHARDVFKQSAMDLGRVIGASGKKLVYGGMDAGLMGLLAINALKAGGHVTGIVPQKLKDSERILENLSDTILVQDLWDRKKRMFQAADAIISLPGGYGTLDESLEVLYWANFGLHFKPLVLVNTEGYWEHLIAYIKTLPDFDARYLIVVDSIDAVIPALEAYVPLGLDENVEGHLPHFEDEILRNTSEPIIIDRASVENSYYLISALGLKQLGKHDRHIGLLNKNGRFEHLIAWFYKAAEEKFITQKCLKLFTVGEELDVLRRALEIQETIKIDLHQEKWGSAVTSDDD